MTEPTTTKSHVCSLCGLPAVVSEANIGISNRYYCNDHAWLAPAQKDLDLMTPNRWIKMAPNDLTTTGTPQGPVAPMVEQGICNPQVAGSIPGQGLQTNQVIYDSTICQHCGKRGITAPFSEGGIAYIHGLYAMWCKHCILTEQLKHALERAAKIPELQKELAELDDQESAGK